MTKARDLANASTALSAVSAAELAFLDGVTSAVQTQIDGKIAQATAVNPTIIDAKGDIITATAADTPARLAVGNNGETLVADSVAATGLAYKTKGVFNGLTTTGDTIYSSSGTTQSRLGIGSTGQVLTVASGVPSWATPATSSQKIIQMVTGTYSTSFSTSSTSYVDAGLSVSITPTLNTSTIAIWHNGNYFMNAGATSAINIRILRGATTVKTYNSQFYDNNNDLMRGEISLISVDAPATTSATTYKIQICNDIASAIGAQYNNEESRFILMEVGA